MSIQLTYRRMVRASAWLGAGLICLPLPVAGEELEFLSSTAWSPSPVSLTPLSAQIEGTTSAALRFTPDEALTPAQYDRPTPQPTIMNDVAVEPVADQVAGGTPAATNGASGDQMIGGTSPYPVDGAGCCDGCYGECCPPCCPPPVFWYAGTEATFLAPDLNTGFVSYQFIDVAPQLDATFSSEDIDVNDLYVAPRLWLGVQRGCWGVVARYWHLQAGENGFDPFFFGPGVGHHPGYPDLGYTVFNQFEAYTIDVEVTRAFCYYDTKNQLSFGVRYGLIEQAAGINATADLADGLITGYARSNRLAHGTGLTSSWFGRKPLFCHSCIHLFYGLRGSVLWGTSEVSAETGSLEIASGGGAGAGSFNGAAASIDDTMFIGETQLGLQWDYRVICFPADAFFRIGVEYQYWDGGGGSAISNSFAGFGPPNNFTGLGDANAVANGIQTNLVGFVIGTGFTW